MNRANIVAGTRHAVSELVRRNGYVSAIDVFLKLGVLDHASHQDWRRGRVPYLESVTRANLAQLSVIVKTMAACCREMGLKESRTDYRKSGKGPKTALRFSKSGSPEIERAYATHFVSQRLTRDKAARREQASAEAATPERVAVPTQTVHIETDPTRLKQLAEHSEQAHLRLRADLKMTQLSGNRIDALFHKFEKEVCAIVDCTQCGNCCAVMSPELSKADVKRLAVRIGISPEDLRERYLRKDEELKWCFATQPCPFLEEKRCSLYEDRPEDCRSFPHLHKKDMVKRLWGLIAIASVCPIAYEVLERVRIAFYGAR